MSIKTEVYELTPTDGRKSFYGKAKAIVKGGWKYLRSYDTIMGGIDPKGKEHRYSDHKSKTTCRHVKSFFTDGFWKLPVEKSPKITVTI